MKKYVDIEFEIYSLIHFNFYLNSRGDGNAEKRFNWIAIWTFDCFTS